MRLLVVEDENLLRQQIEQRLSKAVSYTHLPLPTKA